VELLSEGVDADVRAASPSNPSPAVTAHGVTTHQGDVNLAGRDVNVHNHYHSYPDEVDITVVLSVIRNMRTIHLDNLSKATPGTGVWFFKTKTFLMWVDLNGDLQILWGSGIRKWSCRCDPR
jgi:hypothetical protein